MNLLSKEKVAVVDCKYCGEDFEVKWDANGTLPTSINVFFKAHEVCKNKERKMTKIFKPKITPGH